MKTSVVSKRGEKKVFKAHTSDTKWMICLLRNILGSNFGKYCPYWNQSLFLSMLTESPKTIRVGMKGFVIAWPTITHSLKFYTLSRRLQRKIIPQVVLSVLDICLVFLFSSTKCRKPFSLPALTLIFKHSVLYKSDLKGVTLTHAAN